MHAFLEGLGVFIYPFLVCSLVATYVIIERWVGLRPSRILQHKAGDAVSVEPEHSVAGRLLAFVQSTKPNLETVRAFIDVELSRMERGLFWLGAIVGVAPLLGLLGTVSGLVQVFGNIASMGQDMETNAFVSGIALALTTTMVGLFIAIPSLLAHTVLTRRIEKYAAELYLFAQQCLNASEGKDTH